MAASDILRNNVKEKLARGEVVASMTVRLSRSIEIARIAKTAGFDMLYIDLEHSPLTMDATGQICMACLDIGIMPAVRVPANTPDYISRILDAGALGVIAPHVRTAAEAREVVKAAKLPPLGERSNTGIFPHLQYRSFPAEETAKAINDATMVIVQFESADCLAKADEIIAVEGVDIVLVGLNDMLGDMGLAGQYDHPQGARNLPDRDRCLPQARQALRRRRARQPSRPDGGICADGRALRLDRHRSGVPARRRDRAGQADQGHQALMAEPSHRRSGLRQRRRRRRLRALAARKRMACRRRMPPPSPAAWSAPTCAASTPTASAGCRSISSACARA